LKCTNAIVHSQIRINPSNQLTQRLLTLLFVLVSLFGNAQQGNEEQCAAHLRHEKLLITDPVYKRNHENAERQIQGILQNITINGSNGAQAQIFGDTLEIPVVVHVIHTGQSVGVGANIATSQINDAITVLNDRYRKTPNTHGDANGVDTEIQFVLAKRDPDCNSTTGIVRVNGSSVTDYADEGITAGQGSGAVELDVKALSRWPATDYLNIWVVTEIEDNGGGFGIQGYAYFPGVSASYDGVVIMNTCFGTTGTVNSWNNLNRTLTHEVGHYFNLYHTFEGDNSGNNCPGTTNGCGSGSGDCCGDTEPHIRAASNCPTGTNGCTSTSWDDVQHNYMNYSSQSCADMFTDNQSDRMRAALLGPRHSLLSSLGTEAPSTNTVASASCSPNTTNLSNTFGLGVGNVTFEDIDVTSDGAVGDGGYRDYSCHHMAEVDPSTSYSISIKSASVNNEDARVYIDYNDDGDFLDNGEFVFTSDTDTLHTGTIAIPSNPTLTTPLRMRVISDWQGNTTAMNTAGSCYTPQYGQVEDYAIYVRGSMTATMSGTDVSCNGGNDGSVTVTVGSGTANYGYSWSNGSSTNNSSSSSNTVTGLAAGTYTVTVTDANSTTVSASYTIGEPSTSVSASITLTQEVACFGGSDGSLTASGSGGTGAFTFAWSNGASTASNTGLTAGTYTVTVTDANGCTDTDSETVNQPSAALGVALNVDSNASCNGSATGGITATPSGGTTAYAYLWSTGTFMNFITGLSAGTYSVTLTDANSCTATQSATVTQPTNISLSITVDSNASCGGSGSGGLTASASGGVGSLSYAWNTSATTQSITGLTAGTYTVTVTDANGCTESLSQSITGGSSLSASVTANSNASCNGGSDGSLTASATGGTNPTTYVWNNGASTATITGLTAGTYTVTATENGGCTATATGTISEPTALVASISVNMVSCNGGNDGSMTASASGGTTSYTFAWNTGSTSATATGLAAGTYTVTVTDANGCTDTESATLSEPSAISLSINVDSSASCGSGSGGLTASASGGVGTFSYAWSTSATSASISGLSAGTYTVTVTDANGCTESLSQSLTSGGSSVSATVTVNSNVSCNGSSDGSLTASSTGGANPISYLWSTGATSATVTGLSAGSYTVTVTENGGCTTTATGTISEPSAVIVSITASNVSCNGGNDGSLTVSAIGGSATYTYAWSMGSTSSTLSGLTSGTYTVTATDANGCTDTESVTITQPTALLVSITIDSNAGCGGSTTGGLTASSTGGTGTVTYVWNTGGTSASVTGLIAGTYSVTATDANGCTDSTNQTITSSGSSINTIDTVSICNGDSVLVHGNMVNQPGTYTDTLSGSGGCDSISIIVVQNGLNAYSFFLTWIYQGDSVFLGGAFQTTSNIYLDTFSSSNGCDSVVETLLWVYPVQFGTDSITICQNDSVLLGGIFRSTAGTYADTTFSGGTAIINSTTLFISVPAQVSNSMSIVSGDSAYIAGSWRTTAGTYCDTIGSCDSVICTTLTVNVVTYLVINDTVALCAGDSAFAGGAYQYNAGFYLDTVGNNFGQDTIYSTEIVVDLNSVQIYSSGLWLKSNQSVGPFQWYDCNSQTVIMTTGVGYMMPGYSGSFALINQSATCNDTSVCVNHANTSNKTGLDVRGYPTTVSEQYSISFSSVQKDVSIDLFDIQGQLIQTWKEQDVDLITLPMEHHAPGYYLVRLSTMEGQRSLKFVKLTD